MKTPEEIEVSGAARALVLAADARTSVAQELIQGIVAAAHQIEESLAQQGGRWVALSEVLAAEKAARPRTYVAWAKSLVGDLTEAKQKTFLRDLNRIRTLHAAAQLLLPAKVGELHELIFHRPEEFKQAGQEIIIEIGEALQAKSEADSKHGLFKWASEHSKPAQPKRVRPAKPVDKTQREQAELDALIGDLLGATHALGLDKSIGLFARYAEREPASFRGRRKEICEALDALKAKLHRIK